MARVSLKLGCVALALLPAVAAAEEGSFFAGSEADPSDVGAAIQNRLFSMNHEVDLSVGSLPADPYYKGYTLGLGYTWHFHDAFAWEILRAAYSANVNTHLKEEVLRVTGGSGQDAAGFSEISVMGSTRVVFKPLYGKQSILNSATLHLEAFLSLGADVLYVEGVPGRRGIPRDRVLFGFDFGGGVRVFANHLLSLRVDVNEVIFFPPTGVRQSLQLRLGLAFNIDPEEWFL